MSHCRGLCDAGGRVEWICGTATAAVNRFRYFRSTLGSFRQHFPRVPRRNAFQLLPCSPSRLDFMVLQPQEVVIDTDNWLSVSPAPARREQWSRTGTIR